MTFRMDGLMALVTGAGGGIGEAIALAFADAGADLVLVARTREHLEAVSREIVGRGGKAPVLWNCDVTDAASMRARIDGLSRLDVIVNNAGTNIPMPFGEVSEQVLDQICGLNIRASFLAAQAGVRKMLENPARKDVGGSVIFITSQMGHVGSPNRTVYCMSKHALEGLTKAMAVELAPSGVRVNTVAPTFVDTPLIRRIVDTPEKRDFLYSKIPLGRLATVDEVAAATLFLACGASAMVTGTSVKVDGGWTAQ